MQDLISVVVPVYNAEKWLEKCVKGIIGQTYKNLEIILVNDGSTDNSGDICNKLAALDNRIKVVNKNNGGVSSARNIGIQKSTGKFICFIDSDDTVSPTHIEHLINSYKPYSFTCCTSFTEFGFLKAFNKDVITVNIQEFKKNYLWITCFMVTNSPFNKIYLTEIIKKYNIEFDVKIKIGEDAIFNLDYLKHVQQVIVANKDTYFYSQNLESATHQFNDKNTLDRIYTNNLLWQFFENSDNSYNYSAFRIMTFLNIINYDLKFNCEHSNKKDRLIYLLNFTNVENDIKNLKMPLNKWFVKYSLIRILKFKNYKKYLKCVL